MLDDRPGDVQDGLRGAVVLLEPEHLAVGVVPLEVQDVPDIRPAERVDALGIVADHADVLEAFGQLANQQILDAVGILVLVHEDVLEPVLVPFQHVAVAGEEFQRLQEKVVEVQRIRVPQAALVFLVDLTGALDQGIVPRLAVLCGPKHLVLRDADAAPDARRAELLLGDPEGLHDAAHQRLGIVGVVDGEVAGIAELLGLEPEEAGAERMERPHPERLAPLADQGGDPALHLPRRLVREGERQDGPRRNAEMHQVRGAVREDARLPAARTRHDHDGAVERGDCFSLNGIEVVQEGHNAFKLHKKRPRGKVRSAGIRRVTTACRAPRPAMADRRDSSRRRRKGTRAPGRTGVRSSARLRASGGIPSSSRRSSSRRASRRCRARDDTG